MIPFPFNENRFSFFCCRPSTSWPNPKSDRSLLSCLKVIQCSTREIGDVPLYNSFSLVSSKSHIMPSHIFEVGLKVNTKVYLDVLKSMVIPWCNQVAGGRPWVWQQDSAPAHKFKETQFKEKECYDFVPFFHCPPSSPDLNPLDYFVWSYVENITNMTSHNTKASLIAAIRRVFAELPPALVEKACSLFRIRIEAVIEAEGGYIE